MTTINQLAGMFTGRSIRVFSTCLTVLTILILQSGCRVNRPVPYFGGGIDSLPPTDFVLPEQVIQRGDVLSITFYSDNPAATQIFNQASGTALNTSPMSSRLQTSEAAGANGGYLVDVEGNIRMHALGKITAAGLTKKQLETTLLDRIKELGVLTNPYCVIRFSNFRVTVLGEVKAPGVYQLPSEKASILEALGLAGDITVYGRKDNVMVVREMEGKRTYAKLDLTRNDIFSSPYYFIRQNDVIVVTPDEGQPTARDLEVQRKVTIMVSIVSMLVLLTTALKN
jgi:polysaccharide export outer membrane protein